jgi:hypothetical protein
MPTVTQTVTFSNGCSSPKFINVDGPSYDVSPTDFNKRLRLLHPSGCKINLCNFNGEGESIYFTQIAGATSHFNTPSGMIINNSGQLSAGQSSALFSVSINPQEIDLI